MLIIIQFVQIIFVQTNREITEDDIVFEDFARIRLKGENVSDKRREVKWKHLYEYFLLSSSR